MEPHHPDWPPLSAAANARWVQRLALLTQLWPAIDALLLALDAEEEDNTLAPHTITTREHVRHLKQQYERT